LRGDNIAGRVEEGGGDRSLGDVGHRGVSRKSVMEEDLCGCCTLVGASNCVGSNCGLPAAVRARCTAAAEGGFAALLLPLADRDGMLLLV
jgi:hypothetical protein